MGEQEWLNATRAFSLLYAARQLSSERKLRLVACACARHFCPTNAHPDLHRGVEMAEQIADGTASRAVIESARELFGFLGYVGDFVARGFTGENMFPASFLHDAINPRAVSSVRGVLCRLSDYEADMGSESLQTIVPWLRDIFGNPFRPIDFAPWRTDTAVSLAKQMYDSCEFSAMPILADALQDAGCDNEDVLTHCRDAKQLHVRGCWVVDGVLGKE